MSNIQKTLDSLQPYVIGIRYLEGTPIVDVVFKEGWSVPEDANIKKLKGNDEMNYYMLFSEANGIGLDELLNYVERTIKLNQEKEKKHDLLREKVNELKEIFKKTPLTKLMRLRFNFTDEDLLPTLNEFDIDLDDEEIIIENEVQHNIEIQPRTENSIISSSQLLDENHNPIELTEEEKEMIEEEARAERNRKNQKKPVITPKNKVELPPRRKIEMAVAESEYETDCECGPNEACDKCIDGKGF